MVTIVVGGQYGSEAKGKTVVKLTEKLAPSLVLRSGGPNAGHVVWVGPNNDTKHVTRQLPSALAVPGVKLGIAAGGMVNVQLLQQEIAKLESLGVNVVDRLWIDPFASVVEEDAGDKEQSLNLGAEVGSTQTGTGWTQSQRVLRKARVASEIIALRPFIRDVTKEANIAADKGNLIIEGTQGFGLSLYHGGHYPQCTSRDSSAAGFASECGISPLKVTGIWMVIRTFPIRVGGNSGPIRAETDWDYIRDYSGSHKDLTEITSVTKRVRRVGLFDWGLLARAVMVNRPSKLVVHGLDYLDYEDLGKTSFAMLSERSKGFIRELECRSKTKVGFAYTGPHQRDLIDFSKPTEQIELFEPDSEGGE